MIIKVLGTGCAKCKQLEENARQAANELGIATEVLKVSELDKIMDFGVMITPALVVEERVVSSGKLLSINDIKILLQKEL